MTDSEEQPLTRREARKLAKREAKLARTRKKASATEAEEPSDQVTADALGETAGAPAEETVKPVDTPVQNTLNPMNKEDVGLSIEDEFDFLLSNRSSGTTFGKRSDNRRRAEQSGEAATEDTVEETTTHSDAEETFNTPNVFPPRSERPSLPVTFSNDALENRPRRASYMRPREASDEAINNALSGESLDLEPGFFSQSLNQNVENLQQANEEPKAEELETPAESDATPASTESVVITPEVLTHSPEPVIPVDEFLEPDEPESEQSIEAEPEVVVEPELEAEENSENLDGLTPLQRALATGQISPDMVKSAMQTIQSETQALEIIPDGAESEENAAAVEEEEIIDVEVVSEHPEDEQETQPGSDDSFEDALASALEADYNQRSHSQEVSSASNTEDDYIAAVLGLNGGADTPEEPVEEQVEEVPEEPATEPAVADAEEEPTESLEEAQDEVVEEAAEETSELEEEEPQEEPEFDQELPGEESESDTELPDEEQDELVEAEEVAEAEETAESADAEEAVVAEAVEVADKPEDIVIDPVAEAFRELAEAQGISLEEILGTGSRQDQAGEETVESEESEESNNEAAVNEFMSDLSVVSEFVDVESTSTGKIDVQRLAESSSSADETTEKAEPSRDLADIETGNESEDLVEEDIDSSENFAHPEVSEDDQAKTESEKIDEIVQRRASFIPGMAAAEAALAAAKAAQEQEEDSHITDLPQEEPEKKTHPTGSVDIAQSLVVPTGEQDIRGPLSNTGEIVLTGTIGLPSDFGETGSFTPLDKLTEDEDFDQEFAAILDPMRASSSISAKNVEGDRSALEPQEEKASKKRALGIGIGAAAVAAVGLLVYGLVQLL